MAVNRKTLPPKEEKKQSSSSALQNFLKTATHYNNVIPEETIISSGSLILDSDIQVRSGMIVRLVGKGSEVGKSSQGFVFLENYMKTMPNSKCLYVKAEGRLSKDKSAKTGLKFVYDIEDWTEGTVFVVCSNIAEPIFKLIVDTVHDAYHAGERIAWMIDSMDGLILEDDLKKGVTSGGMVAGVPKLTKLLFRHLALPNMHYDALGIITGQYAAQIKIDTYSPTAPNQGSSSGGSSQQHQADYVFEYQPVNQGDLILENDALKPDKFTNKILGKFARIKILKSADDVTGNMYSVPIRRGEQYKGSLQVWQSKEVADLLIGYQLLSKGGAWLTFEADIIESAKSEGVELQEKINGINKLYNYLEEDSAAMEFLKKKILAIITE
jgi:hypothetical protein